MADRLRVRLQAYLGEWFLDRRFGLPWYDGEVAARDYKKRPDQSGSGRWNNSIASKPAPTEPQGQASTRLHCLLRRLSEIGTLVPSCWPNSDTR